MEEPALNTTDTSIRADVVELAKPQDRGDPIVCFSHLRWDFVFQRPQHLMTRFARTRTVVVFEEPVPAQSGMAMGVDLRRCAASGVVVATPRLPEGLDGACRTAVLRQLLDEVLAGQSIEHPVLWYYTPMMLPLSRHIEASAVVYDCMDELSAFKFAPPEMTQLEAELMSRADVVFTGGYSLYEAKQGRHDNIHPFPSSVEREHFKQARSGLDQPPVQAAVTGPRLGFYGVIDERMDLELLAAVADARPDWSLVLVGPVVKIAEQDLPRRPNIHYMGQQSYDDLPAFLSGWDVALMPFAINESTRFISPTKTPEYLAAGRPVVSTPIRDVVRHYGELQGVKIADTAEAFVAACEAQLALKETSAWLEQVDEALASLSWEQTQLRMSALIDGAVRKRLGRGFARLSSPVAAPAIRTAGRAAHYDALVVGAGFAGSVLAERLASSGHKVLVVDRRPHIAGNAYDRMDEAGVLMHQYGPHIFHTNSAEVFDYLSRFTEWRLYEHRVLAQVGDKLVPMPINRTTLNALYGVDLQSDEQAEAFLASRAEPVEKIRTSEDVVISAVGRELYETFFRGYTRKQWGLDPSELDKSVTARVPTRTNIDDRYFTDTFQAMPLHGYTKMFEKYAGSPEHPGGDGRRIPRCGGRSGPRSAGVHRPDRRVLRSSLRQAALSVAALPPRDAGPAELPARRHGQLSGRGDALYAHHRIQAPDRPVASAHDRHLRISCGGRRPVLSDPSRRKPGAVQEVRSVGAGASGRSLCRTPGDLSLLQHGSSRRAGPNDLPQAASGREHGRRGGLGCGTERLGRGRGRLQRRPRPASTLRIARLEWIRDTPGRQDRTSL